MERLSIEPILQACELHGLDLDSDDTSFIYSDPTIVHAVEGLPKCSALFEFLERNARSLPDDLGIRPERRVELGRSLEL